MPNRSPARPLCHLACLLALLAAPLMAPAVAQDDASNRFPVVQDGQWGYIDSTGAMAVAPQFDEAEPFSDGWARVKVGEAFKFIDSAGEVVLEPEAVYVGSFSDGRAVVRLEENGKLGYIDKRGEVVIAPQFAEAYQFSEGRAPVYTGDPERATPKYGYIGEAGEFVIEPQFWGARRFSGGRAPVLVGGFVDGQWGYIDDGGEMVIKPQFENALPFSEGRAAVSVGDSFDAKWGYIDEEGRQVIEPKYELARAFAGGVAPVEDMFDDWQYIDRNGEQALEKEYAYAEPFAGGLARVAVEAGGGGHGSQGGTMEFFSGVADADWRYIDRRGRRVWPASFGTETVFFEALGFRVHYPANWTASWGRWDDPFAGEKQATHSFQRVQHGEAAPADANALMFSGDEAPQGLMIFAHRAGHRPLPALVEALRTRQQAAMSGRNTSPDYTMNASSAWSGHPAREIVISYGFGGNFHRIVRAGGVRYVATCQGMTSACRKAKEALDEQVELELLNAEAEPVGEAEREQIAAARPPEDAVRAKLKELLPAEGLLGLERVGIEEEPAPPGGKSYTALYTGEDRGLMISVALFGEEKMNEFRSGLDEKAGQQETVHKKQHRGRTVYEETEKTTLTVFLGGGVGLMMRGEDMKPGQLYTVLDALDLDQFAALADE